MRNLKKILALVLALMMVLSVMVTASAAFEDADQINPAYEQAVEVMAAAGILNGTGNGFEPTKALDRASAAKLIAYLATGGDLTGIVKCETVFDDVPATEWYSGFVAYCTDNGYVNGTSETTYAPNAKMTVESYAKLLLGVLGVKGTYTGDKWYVAVRNNAVAKKLMNGMVYTWTAEVTREQAAQMTYNAMLADAETKTVVTGGYYMVDGFDFTFASASDAYFFSQGQTGATKPAVKYVPQAKKEVKVTALLNAFDIKVTNENDPYGAPATKVAVKTSDDDAKNDVVLYYAEGFDFDYTNTTLPKTIATDLKDYYVLGSDGETKYTVQGAYVAGSWDNVLVTTDGVAGGLNVGGKLADALASLTGPNTLVHIYTEKKAITQIVVTNTYVDTVKSVDKGNAEKKIAPSIVLTEGGKVETEGYIPGEVVTYTKCNGKVENLAKAEYIMGTLSSFNSKTNSYTVNGTPYTLDGVTVDSKAVAAMFSKAHVFYLGANDTIVAIAENLPTETPVEPEKPFVPTDYAVIDAVSAKVVTGVNTGDLWNADETVVVDVLAQVKAFTSDGSYAIYDLEVTKAAADIKDLAGNVLVAKNAWYIVVGGEYYTLTVAVDTTAAALTAEIEGILADNFTMALTVYPYTAENGVITLYAPVAFVNGAETESGVYARRLATDKVITAASLLAPTTAGVEVMINENTSYLLGYDTNDKKPGVEEYKNTTALAGTVIAGDNVMIIVDVTVAKNAKGEITGRTYTAKYAFAYEDTFNAGLAPVVPVGTEMVYVDAADYTLTEMSKDGNTYIYNVVKVDGTTSQLKYVAAAPLASNASGIYLLKTDGSLGTKVEGQVEAKVGTISGTTVKLGDTYKVVNGTTTVVGEFATGAEVVYILHADANGNPTNTVKLVFVTKAAE